MPPLDLNLQRTAGGLSLEWVNGPSVLTAFGAEMYAASVIALNRTALEAAAHARTEAAKKFTVRGDVGRRFFNQSFQVTQFATKTRPEIAFGVTRALLAKRSGFLIDHEDGADRVAKGRNDFPYIPASGNSLRPRNDDLLPRWAYPKALGLVKSGYLANGFEAGQDRTPGRRGSKRGLRARENRKAFILRDKQGDPVGIFRRIPLAGARISPVREGGKKLTLQQRRRRGSGQSTLELLFFTPRIIQIRPRLDFRRTAEHELVERFEPNLWAALADVRQARAPRNLTSSREAAQLLGRRTR